MSLLKDILGHKIETNDTPKQNTLKQILNNQISQNTQPNGVYQRSIFASRSDSVGSPSLRRNLAAQELEASRKNYQDFLKEQTKSTTSLITEPLSSKSSLDLTAKTPEMVDVAQKRAQDLYNAARTQKAKELKEDVKQKQSNYNYENYLKNLEDIENSSVNIFDKVFNPITSAVSDLVQADRLDPESQYHYDAQGNKSYLPTKSSLKKQKVREESGAIGRAYNDVVYNLTKAATSKLIDMVAPGAGTTLYYGDIVTDSVEEAQKQGYSKAESVAYGTGVGVVAATLDKFLGTFGGLSNLSDKIPTMAKGLDKVIFKIIGNKTASTIISNMGTEAISEFAEEYVDNALKYVINSDQSGYDSFVNMLGETLPDAAYAGLIGGISGGIGGTIENITNDTELQERKKALEDYKNTLEKYKPRTVEEANYKNDEINKTNEAIQQIEQREEQVKEQKLSKEDKQKVSKYQEQLENIRQEQKQLTTEEQKEVTNKKQKETIEEKPVKKQKTTNNKEQSTYKTAQNVDTSNKGYTAYFEVEPTEARELYGRKDADYKDITYDKLNNGGFDLITYNDNGTRNVYEFNNKTELNKYIKSIGGYSALEGNYTIMSNTKEGEFYYVRDKYAKGGWDWEDVNGRKITGWIDNKRTTREIQRQEKQIAQIDNVATEAKLSKKATSDTKQDVKKINNIKNQSPQQNIDEGNITINSKSVTTNVDERMQDNVLRITTPTENPETVNIGKYKVKKPSAKEAAKPLSDQIEKAIDNLSQKEKQEINEERRKKGAVYKKAKAFAENTNNKELSEFLDKAEEQAYYNQLDISANFLEKVTDTYKDVDAMAEEFDIGYLNVMAGLPDGTALAPSSDLIAKGQGLQTYYLDHNMINEAGDIILKLNALGSASGQASAQFDAMYQYTPYGIYSQTVTMIEKAYNDMANRKGRNSKWAIENNPNTNPDSKFRLTKEQADYILHESSELFDLHGKNWKEYSKRKGLLQNYIGDIIPHGNAEGFANWVRTSLLLGTRTIFKNSGSNIIDTAYHADNKINYTIYDKAVNKVFGTGIRTAGISMDGQKAGFKAGVKTSIESLNDIIHGTNTSEFGNRYMDTNQSRENITKDFFGTMPNRYQTKIKKLNAAANWLSQLANNTMTWGDAKFAASSYEDNRLTLRKLNALEQHKANPTKNIIYDITVDEAGTSHVDYINAEGQYAHDITNDIEAFTKEKNMVALKGGDRIDKLALEYAQSRTYTGDTSFSKATNTILNAVNSAAAKVPVLKQMGIKPTNFIVPFSKIGSNLCYKMYRGSILSIPSIATAYQNFKAEVDIGQVSMKTQHELVSRLGDLTTGTMFYIVMSSLAKGLFNNAEGDDDDDESAKISKFMKSIFGKDKYTFKVGDYNFSFDVGGNLTNMLKLSLDLKETGEKEDATLRDYIEVTFKDILSEWTVSNLTDLFNDQYSSGVLDNILQTMARIPSMAIPSFMKDVAMTIDNFTERSVWDEDLGTYAINSIKSKLPFARNTLPEKTDSWGNTMKVGDNLITQVWNTYIVGNQIKKETSDPVSQELMNIYLITNVPSVIPNVNKSSFSYNNTKYELNDEEEKQYLQVYAKSAHDNLDKLFSSSQYQNADTETKLKYIDEIYIYANDEAKKDYLNRHNISYYNYGKKIIITGQNNSYEQARILDSIDQNISYESTIKYQDNPGKFKYYQSFGSYETYKAATDNIDDIRTTYSQANGYTTAQRKQQVINYVNSLNNLSAVQKAILIKQKYPSSYKSYNDQIKVYLKKQNLDEDTYNEILADLKIK